MASITARVGPAPFEPVLAPVEEPRSTTASHAKARRRLVRVSDAATAVGVLALVVVLTGALGLTPAIAAAALWWVLLGLEEARVGRAAVRFGAVAWSASALELVDASSAVLLLTTLSLAAGGTVARRTVTSVADRLAPAPPLPVLALGSPLQVRRAADELARDPGFELVGVCPVADVPLLEDAIRSTGAQAVVVLPSDELDARTLRRIGWRLEGLGVQLYVGSGLLDVDAGRVSADRLAGLHVVRVRPAARRGPTLLVKEVAERLLAAAAIVLLAPLFLLVTVVVRLDSHGPALFRQVRIGRDGAEFSMLKFRTMLCDAETQQVDLDCNDADGVLFKLRADPRVTRVGRWLRTYSLDELPQLVNIVRGEMSLVGPRPALPGEVEQYDDDPRRRLVVKPGLTGLWQVSGRSDLSWDESVRLDLRYVDNWSLGLDARIVARTAAAVLQHRGAY